MVETRGADKKTTLLHYLCSLVDKKFPELASFADDLKAIGPACSVSFSDIENELKELRNGLKLAEKELNYASAADPQPNDNFRAVVETFLSEAQPDFEELERRYQKMVERYAEVVRFYGEDPIKMPPTEFFVIFKQFADSFDSAAKENKRQIELAVQQEKRAKMQAVSRTFDEYYVNAVADTPCLGERGSAVAAIEAHVGHRRAGH